jgi:hypothetical protein
MPIDLYSLSMSLIASTSVDFASNTCWDGIIFLLV